MKKPFYISQNRTFVVRITFVLNSFCSHKFFEKINKKDTSTFIIL